MVVVAMELMLTIVVFKNTVMKTLTMIVIKVYVSKGGKEDKRDMFSAVI